jgi:hypothetical protein
MLTLKSRKPPTGARACADRRPPTWYAIQFILVGGFIAHLGCSTPPATTSTDPALSEIVSPTNNYSVMPMIGGWSVESVDVSSFADSDMVLRHEEVGITAVFYLIPGASDSLDNVVLSRRRLIREGYDVIQFEEQRRFHGHNQFVPISISTYHVRQSNSGGSAPIISSVVRGPTSTVEILALGRPHPGTMRLVEDLVEGLRILQPEELQP